MKDETIQPKSSTKVKRVKKIGARTEHEVLAEMEKLFEFVWYDRHQVRKSKMELGLIPDEMPPVGWEAAEKIEAKYGEELHTVDDFDWGMKNGKLSALRWILGGDWDNLDT